MMAGSEADPMAVEEIFLNQQLVLPGVLNERNSSYGMFMHAVVLSSFEAVRLTESEQWQHPDIEALEESLEGFARDKGFRRELFQQLAPQLGDLHLDGDEGIKSTAHPINGQTRVVSWGNVQSLLTRCAYQVVDSQMIRMTRKALHNVINAADRMRHEGLRVYALAIRDINETGERIRSEWLGEDFALVALVGVR